MIDFERITLDNGLKVIIQNDRSTRLTALNLLYNVGSKNENPEMTGFAHLFEHLMFGGTRQIPEFDAPLLMAGGESNAFTNNDITNYYLTLPSSNIETGFWLESDRMNEPDFSEKNLLTQKSVVIEEFRQRYLNQPYGDIMFLVRALAYKVHPYRWPTIGLDIEHIRKADDEDVRDFFYSNYAPNNAILSISGNTGIDEAIKMAEKWFGPVSPREIRRPPITSEPPQTEGRYLAVSRDVPANILIKYWRMDGRPGREFRELDLITDIFSGGESGRFENRLVRDKRLFTETNIYLSGELDPGMVVFQGRIAPGIKIEAAEEALDDEILLLVESGPSAKEMEKIMNRFESSHLMGTINIASKAMNLALYELFGDAGDLNREPERYNEISRKDLMETAARIFTPNNCGTIHYMSKKNN